MKRIKKFVIYPAIIISGILLSVQAENIQGDSALRSIEKIRDGFFRADSRIICEALFSLVERSPYDPVTALFYPDIVRCADIAGFDRTEALLSMSLKTAAEQNRTSASLYIRLALENLYRTYNPGKVEQATGSLSFLRSWELAGMKNVFGSGDLYQHVYSEGFVPLKTVQIRDDGPGAEIVPSRYVYCPTGMIRARSSFALKSDVKIRVMSSACYRLRINNRDVLVNDGYTKRNVRLVRVSGADTVSLDLLFSNEEKISFRVLVTDDLDRPVQVVSPEQYVNAGGGTVAEEENYPLCDISRDMKIMPEGTYLFLQGIYLEGCESPEAIEAYRKSLRIKPDPVTEFFLAEVLLPGADKSGDVERKRQGRDHVSRLVEMQDAFAPAVWKSLEADMEDGAFGQVYRRSIDFLKKYPGYISAWASFLPYLSANGCDREFNEQLQVFRSVFPQSCLPDVYAAYHLRDRNPGQFIKVFSSMEKARLPESSVRDLVKILAEAGRYREVQKLIDSAGRAVPMEDELLDNLFRMKDYSRYRAILMRRIALYPQPSAYLRLGLLDRTRGGDGLHFIQAALQQEPGLFSLRDYIEYCTAGEYTHVTGGEGNAGEKKHVMDTSICVQEREWIFQVQENASRAYVRERIYIRNRDDAERYGEYRVPFQGEVLPLSVRVRQESGEATDSYQITRINEDTFVTVSGLKPGSCLEISLIVENPLKHASDSKFQYLPFHRIQEFDEAVGFFSVTVYAPENLPLKFFVPKGLSMEKDTAEDYVRYRVKAEHLSSFGKEPYSMSDDAILPVLAFSNMVNTDEFAMWYASLLRRIDSGTDHDLLREKTRNLRRDNLEETIRAVYQHVNRTLVMDRNVLFYPEDPLAVLGRGRGTVEDRIIAARALLIECGIQSYPAFIREGGRPDVEDYFAPDRFDSMLLFVPLSEQEGWWLDFSSEWLGCGDLSFPLQDRDAVVLVDSGYITAKTRTKNFSSMNLCFNVRPGISGEVSLECKVMAAGTFGETRRYMTDQASRAEAVFGYVSSWVPGFIMDGFTAGNMDRYEEPFLLEIKGTVPRFWIPVDGGIILEPMLSKSAVSKYLTGTRRKETLYIKIPVHEKEEYIYNLPPEYTGVSMEKNSELRSSWGRAEFHVQKTTGSTVLVVRKTVDIGQGMVSPDKFPEFVRFCLDIRQTENQHLFLERDK